MTVRRGKAASLFLLCLAVVATGLNPAVLAQASRPAARRPKAPGSIESGNVSAGVYRNSSFGFSYKIPFGWVDRTTVMQQSDSEQTPQPSKAQVLLAVFERPPEAPRSAINSGVVIAVENISSYPGLKEPVDYFGPLEQVTASKGFKVVNEPYEFPIGEKSVAREDFGKEAGEMTMHQTCLVVLHKGYIVSFTFVSDSDDAMDELLDGLAFQRSPVPGHVPPATRKK